MHKIIVSCFLIVFCSITLSAQWQPITWNSTTQTACDDTTSIRSIRGGNAFYAWSLIDGSICLNAELSPDDKTIHFSLPDSMVGEYIVVNLYGTPPTIGVEPVIAPWGAGEFGLLKVRMVSSTPELILEASEGQGSLSFGVPVESSGQVFLRNRYNVQIGLTDIEPCVQRLIEGGESLFLSTIVLRLKDGIPVPAELDLKLEYAFEQIDGKEHSEIYVPTSSFDGQKYVHEFEESFTRLLPDNFGYRFDVGLEENTPTPQDIHFKKQGGIISLLVQEPDIQVSTGTQEPHRLSFDLTDVEFCLEGELVFPEGSSVKSKGTKFSFRDSTSCLGILPESSFTFDSGPHDDFAEDGVGMLLLHGSSKIHFEENAELSFGGIIALRQTEELIPEFTLNRGSSLIITENASLYYGRRIDQRYSIKVIVNDDASFDMSAASPEVQAVFEVEYAYPSHKEIDKSGYAVFPNPIVENKAIVRRGEHSLPMTKIEIIDVTGRIVTSQDVPLTAQRVEVPMSRRGIFAIRIYNLNGVATNQLVVSR